ncbi:hypothetical protein [uncultured Methanobrevibacter sp.]|uniref:hypothetical protein n=1 Tax=uncultured Methanobrevibacter sp. TaxID=253161 RepID=UPI0025F9342D|nr:hypothetical protein [uncultured Methanobrevibacter sp.]
MGKVIIKKEDEILTLIDEKVIEAEIENKVQRTRICYGYMRDSKMIINDNSNYADMTNMDPLKDDDVVVLIGIGIYQYSGTLYYADGTTQAAVNFHYEGSESNWTFGLMFKKDSSWEAPVIEGGNIPSQRVINSIPLSNLGLDANAPQSTINLRINRQFGYMQTVDVTVTYIDDTTENIKLYQQVMPSS